MFEAQISQAPVFTGFNNEHSETNDLIGLDVRHMDEYSRFGYLHISDPLNVPNFLRHMRAYIYFGDIQN